MAISLTEPAAERVRNYLADRGNGIGLRIGVKKTGCNGFAYVINYAEQVDDDDVVFEERGVKVVVDRESLELIDGTEVDFIKEGRARDAQDNETGIAMPPYGGNPRLTDEDLADIVLFLRTLQ